MKTLYRSKYILAQFYSQWNVRSYVQHHHYHHQSVESRLQKAEEEYLSDAHLRILSSPLRRCQSTMMVLPKLMLLKFVQLQDEGQSVFPMMKELKEEEDALRGKEELKTDRWYKRQAKVMLANRLKREARMLKHKVITSQTDESKAKFVAEMKEKEKQITTMLVFQAPRNPRYTVEGIESNKNRRGNARWCVLDAKAALALLEKRSFHYSQQNIKPDEFLSVIGKTLEKDLIRTVEYLSTLKAEEGWLIRQKAEDNVPLSATIHTDGIPSKDLVSDNTPLYNIDHLFDEKNDFKGRAIDAIQTIAQDTTSNPSTFFVRKHQMTTNLCVALWRLSQWRQSVIQDEKDKKGFQE